MVYDKSSRTSLDLAQLRREIRHIAGVLQGCLPIAQSLRREGPHARNCPSTGDDLCARRASRTPTYATCRPRLAAEDPD